MIVDRIEAYLKQTAKSFNEDVLKEATAMFVRAFGRQLMEEREDEPHQEYATLYTQGCARKSAYRWHGFEGEDLAPRARINFLCGDIVELAVWGLARLAGCNISMNNTRLFFQANLDQIPVRPDGLLDHEGTPYNVEVKKMNEYVFDRTVETGVDDAFGYRTQTMLEIAGWRKAGFKVDRTVLVMLKGLTGHIAEIVVPFEQELVDKALWRRHLVVGSTKEVLPPRGYEAEPETKYNRKTKVYDPTGRSILGLQCGYCAFKNLCWPEAKLETIGGKPLWVVPTSDPKTSS